MTNHELLSTARFYRRAVQECNDDKALIEQWAQDSK